MSVLRYRCPETLKEVVTAIETDRQALTRMKSLKVSVSCPYCETGHSIPADAMFFDPLPAASAEGARELAPH
jgi:hypothetical protein